MYKLLKPIPFQNVSEFVLFVSFWVLVLMLKLVGNILEITQITRELAVWLDKEIKTFQRILEKVVIRS